MTCTLDGRDPATEDPAAVVQSIHKAAEQSHDEAQVALGVCFAQGRGVARDPAKAAEWWRKGRGNPDAQKGLAGMLFRGVGVPADRAAACGCASGSDWP